MIHFMLGAHRLHIAELPDLRSAAGHVAADLDTQRTPNPTRQARQRKTAFLDDGRHRGTLKTWIDERQSAMGPVRNIHHKHAKAASHLGCGKSYSTGGVQRLEQIVDQVCQRSVERSDRLGFRAEHG